MSASVTKRTDTRTLLLAEELICFDWQLTVADLLQNKTKELSVTVKFNGLYLKLNEINTAI